LLYVSSGQNRAEVGRLRRVVPAASALTAVSLYSWLGLSRYASGDSGNYDLGIFTQAAKGWSTGIGPYSDIKGGSLFGDHFSPITIVFGAAYALWHDARSLIFVQSMALALAVAILTRYAVVRLPFSYAFIVCAVTIAAPPFTSAAIFDVHEIALAAPVIAWLCVALLKGRFVQVTMAAVLCLTAKEDVGLFVAAAGFVWWRLHGSLWWKPCVLVTLGVGGFVLANAVVMHANPLGQSPYLHYVWGGTGATAGAGFSTERFAAVLLFLALSGLSLGNPVILLAVPTLAWRIGSTNPHYWSDIYHYDVVLLPVAIVALVHTLQAPSAGRRIVAVVAALAATVPGVTRAATKVISPTALMSVSSEQAAARNLVKIIPAGQVIVTTQRLGPDLVPQYIVRQLDPQRPTWTKWVLMDVRPDDENWTIAEPLYNRADVDPKTVIIRRGTVALIEYERPREVP